MTSSNIVLRIWWKISFVEYLISIRRKFLIIFNIDVAGMRQRWRTFDSKWYEMEMMAKMKIDYVNVFYHYFSHYHYFNHFESKNVSPLFHVDDINIETIHKFFMKRD